MQDNSRGADELAFIERRRIRAGSGQGATTRKHDVKRVTIDPACWLMTATC